MAMKEEEGKCQLVTLMIAFSALSFIYSCAVVFVTLDPNPFNWCKSGRAMFLVGLLAILIISIIISDDNCKCR